MQTARDLLPTLVQPQSGPCVSIYFHKTPSERHADQLRLKALVLQAERSLAEPASALSGDAIDHLMRPLWRLLGSSAFWLDRHADVALFLASGFFAEAGVPCTVDDAVHVGRTFAVRPLLAPPTARSFQLLALHADHVCLYDGDGDRLVASPLHLPSFDRACTHDFAHDLANQPHGKGVDAPMSCGHTHPRGSGDRAHERIQAYYRLIATLLRAGEPHLRMPLVVAGTERNLALFRTSAAAQLEAPPQFLAVDPDGIDPSDLQRRAAEIMCPLLSGPWRSALKRLHAGGSQLPVERELSTIVAAAARGQVDTLLIARGAHAWGRVDSAYGVEIHPLALPGNEDLLNRAAIEVLRHRGGAFEVDPLDLEPGRKVVALMRYQADRYAAEAPKAPLKTVAAQQEVRS